MVLQTTITKDVMKPHMAFTLFCNYWYILDIKRFAIDRISLMKNKQVYTELHVGTTEAAKMCVC